MEGNRMCVYAWKGLAYEPGTVKGGRKRLSLIQEVIQPGDV